MRFSTIGAMVMMLLTSCGGGTSVRLRSGTHLDWDGSTGSPSITVKVFQLRTGAAFKSAGPELMTGASSEKISWESRWKSSFPRLKREIEPSTSGFDSEKGS